ncbi:hypothetical protein CAC42_7742 [Sphaceloma murrayae]|uniref:Pre-mRNA-processing protein prp40 n=1 Tax=Sphaceloma murrayae TaxID=2082308 RepID=A0A2K1QXI8_9PEZI|nr:hypothetical protein CAC42_7742 [Sphaceloma murrayae]
MNGSAAEQWSETPDPKTGRPYYYSKSGKTQWHKPDELLTSSQLATGWTQTSTQENKPYWYNKGNRNETSWTPPAGWEDEAPAHHEESQIVSSSFSYPSRDQPSRDLVPRDDFRRDRTYDSGGYRGPIASTPSTYQNATAAEREAAFTKLLKKVGVQPDWTWEQAIKAGVQDSAFRAIEDPADRKDAFDKYKDDIKQEEDDRKKAKLAKLRTDFRAMLERHPEVQRYSRWKNIRPIIEGESVFRSTDDEEERKRLFEEYRAELERQFYEKRYQDHEEAMANLGKIMRQVNIGPETHWEEAQKMLTHSEAFEEEKYETLTQSEILDHFIGHVRRLWDDVNIIKQRNKQLEAREARKGREGFVQLLRELHSKDILQANSSWRSIYPHVASDPRYKAIIANVRSGEPNTDGSTPLELFFDVIDELDRELRDLVVDAEQHVRRYSDTKLSPGFALEDFRSIISSGSRRFPQLTPNKVAALYGRLMEFLDAQFKEDAAAEEARTRRKAIDALRQRIKSLEPPMTIDDTWELIRPRVERLEEYAVLGKEEDRKAAFDKQMERIQYEAEREKRDRRHRRDKDDRPYRERDRDGHRDRDRDRRRSHTPSAISERDAYAEDRRRATEQRERQYRHTSGASANGLSPPPRDRERRRDDDRYAGRKASLDDPPPPRRREDREDRYDRERRERDAERERAYVSRADPFSKGGELDYGDEGGDAGRKRSGSGDVGGGRKRVKMEDEAKEEKALQSGSEEGEIEEV